MLNATQRSKVLPFEVQTAVDTGWGGMHEVVEATSPEDFLIETQKIISDISLTPSERANKISDLQLEANALRRRVEDAERDAYTDKMTGLFNRAGFEAALHSETNRIAHNESKGAVIVIADVDYLKWANDHSKLGTHFGDALIKATGQNVKNNSREKDIVARYGGDEISGLFTDIDVSNPDEINNLVQHATAKLSSETTTLEGKTIPVVATFGYAVMGPGISAEQAIKNALKDMHDNKNARPARRSEAPKGFENF